MAGISNIMISRLQFWAGSSVSAAKLAGQLSSKLELKFAPVLALLLAVASTGQVWAHEDAELRGITDDGRRVILKQDHTWDFITLVEGDPQDSAVLTVLEVTDLEGACRLKLHLKNNLPMKIVHLVPRMNIYNHEGVLFDSVSKSFAGLRPGKDKYTHVQFDGLGCTQIGLVKIVSAARCRMGDLDIWNAEEGKCLSRLHLMPTDLINISK